MGAKAASRVVHGPAQIGGGDPRVVAHPGFRRIPKCLFPLSTKEAQKRYDDLARMIFDAGKMTTGKHGWLSSYAMQFDAITSTSAKGNPVRSSAFKELNKAYAALEIDDLDKPIAAPEDAPVNKFANAGFSARRR